MSRLSKVLRARAAACSARLTASCQRSSTRSKIRKLRRLQKREQKLLRSLQRNQAKQVTVIRHPLYQEHLRKSLEKEKSLALTEQQFDLHRLL